LSFSYKKINFKDAINHNLEKARKTTSLLSFSYKKINFKDAINHNLEKARKTTTWNVNLFIILKIFKKS
jgi:hypothetical protein